MIGFYPLSITYKSDTQFEADVDAHGVRSHHSRSEVVSRLVDGDADEEGLVRLQ